MERYHFRATLGSGSDGNVTRAVERSTGKAVAVKQVHGKFRSFDDVLRLSEVRMLRHLHHPNIVALKEVVRQCEIAYLVLEVMDLNLHEWLRARTAPLAEPMVRGLARSLLLATQHMHDCGVMHRDLKPANLLVNEAGTKLKVADLAQTVELHSTNPRTPYVSTRWYRAPELLLRTQGYSSPVDLWAIGTIIAELYRRAPLFPGATEMDQLHQIAAVLGTPTDGGGGGAADARRAWREGPALLHSRGYTMPDTAPTPLADHVPRACAEGLELVGSLLRWDPARRPRASECLRHPFFAVPMPRRLADLRDALLGWARRRPR